jgi:hypothetical protein
MRTTLKALAAGLLLAAAGTGCGDRTGSRVPTTTAEPKEMPTAMTAAAPAPPPKAPGRR